MNVVAALLHLTVNGEEKALPAPITVAGLVAALGLDIRKVAVELNREIVPRSTYQTVPLNNRDTIEIVHFIGGG